MSAQGRKRTLVAESSERITRSLDARASSLAQPLLLAQAVWLLTRRPSRSVSKSGVVGRWGRLAQNGDRPNPLAGTLVAERAGPIGTPRNPLLAASVSPLGGFVIGVDHRTASSIRKAQRDRVPRHLVSGSEGAVSSTHSEETLSRACASSPTESFSRSPERTSLITRSASSASTRWRR